MIGLLAIFLILLFSWVHLNLWRQVQSQQSDIEQMCTAQEQNVYRMEEVKNNEENLNRIARAVTDAIACRLWEYTDDDDLSADAILDEYHGNSNANALAYPPTDPGADWVYTDAGNNPAVFDSPADFRPPANTRPD